MQTLRLYVLSVNGQAGPAVNLTAADVGAAAAGHAHAWAEITGRPETFPPESHGHTIDAVEGLGSALAGLSPQGHTHAIADVATLAAQLNNLAAAIDQTGADLETHENMTSGAHGGIVTATDPRLSDARTPTAHTHSQADVTGLVADLAGKAATVHTHAAADITSGTFAAARLGSGTASASVFLRGDGTWSSTLPAGVWINDSANNPRFYFINGAATIIRSGANGTSTAFSFRDGSDNNLAHMAADGKLALGNIVPTARLDVNDNTIRVRTARTPASATATGNAGDICWDASFIYVCTAANTWRRAALAAW